MKHTIYYILISFLVFSCKEPVVEVHNHPPTNYSVNIQVSAGEKFIEFADPSIPTFFNIGNVNLLGVEKVSSLVLGKRRKTGAKVYIEPVALFSFVKDTSIFKYIIALPVDEKLEGVGRDFDSFLVNNYHLQSSIEEWFKSHCNIGSCREFKWDNSYKALLEMSYHNN